MNVVLSSAAQPSAAEPRLRVHLLGSPLVVCNGIILALPRRLVRALLYRLACDPEPVSRGHLRLLFWPDVPESVARRNMSHLLTHLRRALPVPEILGATDDEVRLDPARIWCDVLELKRAEFTTADPECLRYAVGLYHGSFLDGFDLPARPEFEHWCLVERSALEHQYLRLLECLVAHCMAAGEVTEAIQYAREYLETDSLSESMHRQLMRLFAASGHRHLALQQFERCCLVLASDLGVSPLPETRAVYQAVVGGKVQLPASQSPQIEPPLPGWEIPFVGREEELNGLERAFHRLQTQQGSVLLVSGEPGIGKSRLIQEFAKSHRGRAHFLFGRGYAGEQTVPYQPILGILRTILRLDERETERDTGSVYAERSPPDFVDRLWLSEVSRLLPEMQMFYPDLALPLPLEPESAHARLFDALCHLILAYAAAYGPILLCLDDLQWTDAATRAWLVHIGRFLTTIRCPLLILGTYRTEEAAQVLQVRHALAREGVLAELELSGLEERAVVALLRHLTGRRAGDENLGHRLHQATGGNPFYLIETVRKLVEEGRLEKHCDETGQLPLPETVREAIHARLERLSPIARQVLEAGAVLGQSFRFDLLRATAGRSHSEVVSAVEELVARILLVEVPEEVRFVHELTCQDVQESMGHNRRRLLHHRAGRAYQRLDPDAFPALAYHFAAGGNPSKALHYHDLASRQAQELFAWRTAEFHQSRMLELLAQIDPLHDRPHLSRQRAEVLAERAYVRYLQDRPAERDADLEALDSLAEARGDDEVRLLALLNHLRYLNLDGAYARAVAVAEKGLALLESSPALSQEQDQANVTRSRLLAQLGLAYHFLGRPTEAVRVLEEAWDLSVEGAEPEARGRILHILGYVYAQLGDYARSLECQQQAYVQHREAGDFHRMAWDLVDIAASHKDLGDLVEAALLLEEGLQLALRVGAQQARAHGLVHLGGLALYRGEYAAALERYQEALELQELTHSEYVISAAECGLGLSQYHLGNVAESRHWLERALQRAQSTEHCARAAEACIMLGLLDTRERHLPLARRHLQEGLAMAGDCRSAEPLAAGLAGTARLERLSGDIASALDRAAAAVTVARQIKRSDCEMWGEIEAGLALLALGDLPSAQDHTQRAVSLAPSAGQSWIGREEAYRAHARALRALAQDEAAEHYERCVRGEIQTKAGQISDPIRRAHYLSNAHQSLLSAV